MAESLFADIATSRSQERYPATTVIYELVQGIGEGVSQCRRNCETSYRLVELARDLHDEINKKIGFVEESGDWEAYDVSAQAVDPLEELLSGIVPVADEEQDEYLTAAPSIELCKLSIQKWIKNRKLIRTGLEHLRMHDKLKALMPALNDNEDDILGAYARDDRALLSNLLSEIKTNASSIDQQRTKALLEKVIIILESIQNLPIGSSKISIEEELTALSIKCAMIIYGVTKIIADRSATPEILDQYHSGAVWNAAQKLVDDVFKGLKSQKSTAEDLEAEYHAFEYNLLQISTIETPLTYRQLLQYMEVTGQAYQAQSLVLVLLCREAVTHFQNNKNKNYDAVEDALDKTFEALAAAATREAPAETNSLSQGDIDRYEPDPASDPTFDPTFDPTADPTADSTTDLTETESIESLSSMEIEPFDINQYCTRLFEDSANALKDCFEEIGLEGKANPREIFDAAREKDRARVERVKEMLAGRSTRQEPVKVTINVYKGDQSGDPVAVKTCRVPPACRLSFIKWSVAKELPNMDLSNPETSYFETSSAEAKQATRISPNESIQTLYNGGEISLYLIVGAEPSHVSISHPKTES